MNDIVVALEAAGFRQFARAVTASGASDVLSNGAPYTIFAPSDAAFAKFPQRVLGRLFGDDLPLLRDVVSYHFAAGKVGAARFAGKRIRAVTHGGKALIIDGKHGLRVNDARVTTPDLVCGPCLIHGIDGVLWPREAASGAA
ncbi:MAG TPA: fasciclin domain-containing protein [Vitreimonas sp.]|jgi:uncharacterized surface protein with fasciclin (FAS1) repeats|nr:fasciclin domain-containing protein [Vitreimonas sp.]